MSSPTVGATAERLLEAGRDELRAVGAETLTIRTAAQRAGVSPAHALDLTDDDSVAEFAAKVAADVLGIQVPAAYANGELDDAALREIVIFVCHYAGWPNGARLNSIVEEAIAKARRGR